MKRKQFTYNQIVTFFLENKLPLSQPQVQLIALKVKEEMRLLEEYRKNKQAKDDAKFIKRERRKREREAKKELGYSRVGLNNV